MKFCVNDNDTHIGIGAVTYRQLGFGQPIPNHLAILEYEILLSIARFEKLIQPSFDEFVEDIREDDELTCYEDPIPELMSNGYVGLEKMLRIAPNDVCSLIREYLYLELLEAMLGENAPRQCLYSINTVREVSIRDNNIQIRGDAYRF